MQSLYTLLIAGVQSIRTWRCRVQSTFTKSNCIVPNDTQLKRNRHTLSLPTSHYKIANITRDVCPLACTWTPKRKWSLERRISFSSTVSPLQKSSQSPHHVWKLATLFHLTRITILRCLVRTLGTFSKLRCENEEELLSGKGLWVS